MKTFACLLFFLGWCFSACAQAVAPRQRTARTLRPEQVAAAVSNAPAGAKVSLPPGYPFNRHVEPLVDFKPPAQREGEAIIDGVASNPPAAEVREPLRPVRRSMRCACGGEMRSVSGFSPRTPLTPARWPHRCDACGQAAAYDREYPALEWEKEPKGKSTK